MKRKILALVMIMMAQPSLAAEKISAEKLRTSIELQIQTLIMSPDGKEIISPNIQKGSYRSQAKTAELKSTWVLNAGYGGALFSSETSNEFKPLSLDFSLRISDENKMTLSITEYSKVEFKNGVFNKSGKGRSETFDLSNFESVSWVQKAKDHSIVTRFVPVYVGKDEVVSIKGSPMTLSNVIISDNSGRVWMEGASAIGEVVQFGTKQGSILLSFTEFKGSTELGTAEGNGIELKLTDKLTVRIRSAQPVLGSGITAKVFGKYSSKDTSGNGSVRAMPIRHAEEK